jgi:hypothetical protein
MSEVIQKESKNGLKKKSSVSVMLPVIPMPVHNKIMKWRLKRSAELGKQLSSMDAYADFLKEQTKNLMI